MTFDSPRFSCLAAGALLVCAALTTPAAAEFATAGEVWREDLVQTLPPPDPSQEAHWQNTLAGVYELALRNDRSLAAAEASFRAGLEERRLGLAEILPRIEAAYTYQDSEIKDRGAFPIGGGEVIPNFTNSDRETERWSVTLQQPLFDLPAWFRFQRGRDLTEQARADFTVAQQDLMVRTAEAYFAVLRAMANLQASLAQEAALSGQLEQVEQRFEVGLVAITDVFEARAAYDIATADRLGFEGDVEVALENLSVITGRSHSQLWQLQDEFPVMDPTPEGMAEWVEFALQHNADIKVALQQRHVAEHDARAAASEHLPSVALQLSYADRTTDVTRRVLSGDMAGGPPDRFPADGKDTTLSVNVSVPVFAGGAISANRRRAAARHDSQVQLYDATVRQVTQNTRALHISVRRNVARTRARAQAIVSARSALEAAETGYEVGTRNIVDVLDAQRLLFSAIRDEANSTIDFVLDVINLKRQAGLLTPADLLVLNRWLEEPPPPTAPPRPRRSEQS
ncbi:MAG: TolC family outer membrane protein [Gammaproteobacteria bacterium]|nr:TolC family outer membrane protein [Gammaproteobacteria bacterium]